MTRTRYAVDAGVAAILQSAYRSLVKAGEGSVRAAWRFGQAVDSQTDGYTGAQIADVLGVSPGTIARYLRFYRAYQRPELAVEASERLETFNIDLLAQLAAGLDPARHARPAAGRRYRYRCASCNSTAIHREEFDPDAEEPAAGTVVPVRFMAV